MRLRLTLPLENPIILPVNYQDKLSGVVHSFSEQANHDYSRFLRAEGHALPGVEGSKRFKLFCFSPLWCARRRIEDGMLRLGPGTVEWFVTSPLDEFLQEFATALLRAGAVRVGRAILPVAGAEMLPVPEFRESARFTCQSPIVCAVPSPGRATPEYLRPGDERFGEHLRRNLLQKYGEMRRQALTDSRLSISWCESYLKTHRGTKLVDYKGLRIVGAFCPFTLSGSPALIEMAYAAGLGEKNTAGFGMVDMSEK